MSLLKLRFKPFPQLFLEFILPDRFPTDLDVEIDTRGRTEAEAVGEFLQVELVHVEDVALLVRGVGLKEAAVAVFG